MNLPTHHQLRSLLEAIPPEQWQQGDAGIHVKDGLLAIFFAPGYGSTLFAERRQAFSAFLLRRPAREDDQFIEVMAGREFQGRENAFVPFEMMWQAIAYFLNHRDLEPRLLWTEDWPFPDQQPIDAPGRVQD